MLPTLHDYQFTSVRRLVNTRFNLRTPFISSLFYVASGVGFICGSLLRDRLTEQTGTVNSSPKSRDIVNKKPEISK